MRGRGILVALFAVSAASLLAAPIVGSRAIPLDAIMRAGGDSTTTMIFWEIRLPRACLAWISGAGLAVAGMAFQAMFRNALATPFTLGVSSGASLGAAIGIRLAAGMSVLGFSAVHGCAMLGAVFAVGIVYALTRFKRDFSTGAMLLSGVAVNYFFSSLILIVQYTADFHDTFRILRWLMGGLQMVGFDASWQVLPFVACVCVLLAMLAGELNLLTTGEELAASRGVAVHRVKIVLFVSVSLMVGVIVSICGPIGFVGLVSPHICRLLVGADHRRLLPATCLFGGSFLVICDTVARTVFAPTELPVGIFTAFLGGPFFVWLLIRPPKGGSLPA